MSQNPVCIAVGSGSAIITLTLATTDTHAVAGTEQQIFQAIQLGLHNACAVQPNARD
jgi:hypothetical protein